jgi:TRAP transporter TAXI family solute receptor
VEGIEDLFANFILTNKEDAMKKNTMKKGLKIYLFMLVIISIPFVWNTSFGQTKNWPRTVTIGTGSIGGVAYLHGAAVAKVIYDKMGIAANAEVTGGSVHNVKLANSKEATMASSHAASAYDGWNGMDWAKGVKYQDIRSMFHEYDTFVQIYALKKSGVKSIYDLNGKSLGVGPLGGFPHILFPGILEGLGIKASRYLNAGIADLDTQVRDGLVDANANITGMPWVAIREIESVLDVNVFGVSKKDFLKAAKIAERYPFMGSRIIAKGTYKANKDFDIETLTLGSFYYTHKDTPEDFVYEVVKNVCKNWDMITATVPASKGEKPEAVLEYAPVPLHPGALRYYREMGLKIPDRMMPPK